MVFKPMIVDVLEPTFGVFWNFWSKLLAFPNLGEPNVDCPGLLQLNICFLCLLAQNLFFLFWFAFWNQILCFFMPSEANFSLFGAFCACCGQIITNVLCLESQIWVFLCL